MLRGQSNSKIGVHVRRPPLPRPLVRPVPLTPAPLTPPRSAWFAFALPCYSTYKALTHSPSADTLQALSTYWAVVGAFVAFEQTLGLFLSWSARSRASPPCPHTLPGFPFTGS